MGTKPEMFIFNSFKSVLFSLRNQDQNRTPMLANSPVVPAQELQALYENQVAVTKGATNDRVCALFASLARILIVYQDPQKEGIGGTSGPTDHSYDRTGCSIHTDSNYHSRPDIRPHHPTMLPVALKTDQNSVIFDNVLSFIKILTLKLGRIKTIPFRFHMIRYMCGNGMGWHGNGLRLADRQSGYRMRLVINPGKSRKIRFRADQVNMSKVAYGSDDNLELARDNQDATRRYPGLKFEIDTIPGFSAYLMLSHGNGSCFLGYTDETRKVAIQAQHLVSKIGENKGGSRQRSLYL
jgi:hypothetical protein